MSPCGALSYAISSTCSVTASALSRIHVGTTCSSGMFASRCTVVHSSCMAPHCLRSRSALLVSSCWSQRQTSSSSWNERPETLPCQQPSHTLRAFHTSVERCRETPVNDTSSSRSRRRASLPESAQDPIFWTVEIVLIPHGRHPPQRVTIANTIRLWYSESDGLGWMASMRA